MISKMIPHTSATMFRILAVLEASEATVLSPAVLAFWTLKEGKCPNERARGGKGGGGGARSRGQ